MFTSFITLNSNSSIDSYPQNTATNFTNVLPHQMQTYGGKKLFIRLRRLIMSYKFGEVLAQRTSHVKIHLTELEPQTVNTSYEKILAHFQFPPEDVINDEYALHDFEHGQFNELQSVPLHQLTIKITDSNNQELPLWEEGAPTLLILELSDMDYSKQFVITCQSRGLYGPELYPHNTLTKFTARLPQEFFLPDWEVAMLNMTYPPDLRHITSPTCTIEVETDYFDDESRKWTFKLIDYASTAEFIYDIIQSIEQDEFWSSIISVVQLKPNVSSVNEGIQFIVKPDPKVVKDWNENNVVRFSFNDNMWHVFNSEILFNQSHLLHEDGKVTIKGLPDINRLLPSSVGMVYCDIVKPSPVGDHFAPLLQMVPLPPSKQRLYLENQYQHKKNIGIYEPQHLIFHPLESKEFSDIKFEILQPDGSSHNLHGSEKYKAGMSFSLLFRMRDRNNKAMI